MTSPNSLLELLKETASAFNAKGVRYAVSGGLAVLAYGFVRATRDLDILISVPAVQLPGAIETLLDLGCEGDVHSVIQGLRQDQFCALPCGVFQVEVFLPVLPYHHEVLERCVVREIEGVEVSFVSPEDLVILKVLFHRTKDMADVKGIVATLGPELDRDFVRQTLRGLLPAGDPRHAEVETILGTGD